MQQWRKNIQKVIKKGGKHERKTSKKSMRKKGREKERQGPERDLAAGAQEHTIQQDRVLSIKRKTSKKKNLWKMNPWKAKPRKTLTRPGRLRARSGSKLPAANVPLRALEGWVTRKDVLSVWVRSVRFGKIRFDWPRMWFSAKSI